MRRRLVALVIAGVALALPVRAWAQTEVVEYYGLDAIGSVRVVFDANGAVKSRVDYGPFGEQVTVSTTVAKVYAGLFRDGEAGLDYAEARSYQVRTGRFSAPDPVYAGLFQPQAWNRYSYALNSPLAFVDPTGLAADSCVMKEFKLDGDKTTMAYDCSVTGGGGGGPSWNLSLFSLSTPLFGQSGGGVGSGQASSGRSGRRTGPAGTDVALPQAEDQALQNALVDLQNYQSSSNCEQTVITRLQGFVMRDFKSYLSQGADFFDGTKSTTAANSIYPPVAAASWARANPSVTSMASLFATSPGTNATTSLVAPRLTVYVRPTAVDLSNGGVNARNRGFVFHEALHGFGQGNRFMDDDLKEAFNVVGASAGISNHIAQNCR